MILVIAAVAVKLTVVEIVVHSLEPCIGFVHHYVTLGGVELRLGAVADRIRVCIIVGVAVMQRIVGHLAIKVVHRGLDIGDVDRACRGLARHLGEDTVAFFHQCEDMSARHIFVPESVASLVVKITDVGVVGDTHRAFHDRVFRLYDVELREVCAHLVVAFLLHVACEPDGADQGARVGGVAVYVHTAHRHEFVEPGAVIVAVYAGDTNAVGVRAALEQGFPVEQRAVVKDDGLDVAVVLKSQAALRESGEIFKTERGDSSREFCRGDRRSFGEIDALYFRASRVEVLEACLVGKVECRARAAAGLGLSLVAQVEFAELSAVADAEPPSGGTAAAALQVQLAQGRAFAEVQSVLEVVRGAGHVKFLYAACAIDTQGVIYRVGSGDCDFSFGSIGHKPGVGYVRGVVGAVTESIGFA